MNHYILLSITNGAVAGLGSAALSMAVSYYLFRSR